MTNVRRSVLAIYALYLAFASSAGQTFESKVEQLLHDEPENIKCFTETLRDLTCFWDEKEDRNSSFGQYAFTYQYQNENSSVCAVSVLGAAGKRLFLCRLSRIEFFVPLHLCVYQGGRELYNRSLSIDQVLLLDPPANVTVVRTRLQRQLNVTWLPPALKYMDDSMMYEVRYVVEGSPMRKEIVKDSTKLTLRGLQPNSKYKVWVRVKLDGISYNGYWSAWSDPVFGTTPPSDLDPLILVLVLIISLILILLSLTVLLSHHKFLLKKLWPDIPSPERKFPGLFTVYKGDFQEWLGHNNGSTWPVHMYTEELPAPLEVLSEASLAAPLPSHVSNPRPEATPRAAPYSREESDTMEEGEDQLETRGMDAGLHDRWQEPRHTHWLMEQLRALQEHPEALSQSSLLESQDTYVTLNQNSQHTREDEQGDDILEESLPLQALFASRGTSLSAASHSDLGSLQQSSGSGRLSSQSSFEYPNHTWSPNGPGYAYMAVADSGVSMDYSPMSSSRITDMGKGVTYTNEYKNDILEHRQPLSGQLIHSQY
ncbi:erythropoietin receptor [Pygocentrus nattereri]|uniref:Erythropoietin receptor n=1 Tax=Pygocentrus nattereri TaxID=42514 RepID=A0A3B4BQC8_PYGNA|nr:erythropoietin receptor [Pygocentrus nattereri]